MAAASSLGTRTAAHTRMRACRAPSARARRAHARAIAGSPQFRRRRAAAPTLWRGSGADLCSRGRVGDRWAGQTEAEGAE